MRTKVLRDLGVGKNLIFGERILLGRSNENKQTNNMEKAVAKVQSYEEEKTINNKTLGA